MFFTITKKSTNLLVSLLVVTASLFISCSSFTSDNHGECGSVVFIVDEALVNAVKSSVRAADSSEGSSFEVELSGDYNSRQSVPLIFGQKIVFENVPVKAVLHAEARIWRTLDDGDRVIRYLAKSEEIKITKGENQIRMKLEKNPDKTVWESRIYVSSINGSDQTGDGSYESPLATIEAGLSLMASRKTDYMLKLEGSFSYTEALTFDSSIKAADLFLVGYNEGAEIQGASGTVTLQLQTQKTITLKNIKISKPSNSTGVSLRVGFGNDSEITTVILGEGAKVVEGGNAGVLISDKGKFIVDGGEVVDNGNQENNNCGINNGGILEIKSGVIKNNNVNSPSKIGIINNGTLLMSDQAVVDNSNIIKFSDDTKKITVAGALTAATPVAKILPYSYTENTVLIELASDVSDISLADASAKFAVLPEKDGNGNVVQNWIVAANGTLQKEVVESSSGSSNGNSISADFVFVEGSTILATSNNPVVNSQVFITNREITIRDLLVCKHEVTQKEFFEYVLPWADVGEILGVSYMSGRDPNETYGVGDNYPINTITWYQAILYCNARSKAEGLEQVYYLTPEYTDHPEDNYVPVYDIDEWTSITKTGGEFFFNKYENNIDPEDSRNGKYYVISSDRLNSLNHPLVGIKMDITKNGYRLLTEAEWEYCARGGKNLIYSKYSGTDDVSKLSEYAWFGDSYGKIHEVMQKKANNLGLYDMCGNVFEWCFDVNNSSITVDTPETGYVGENANDTVGKVCRGGSWSSDEDDNYNHGCAIYTRGTYTVESFSDHQHGIRLCRTKTD